MPTPWIAPAGPGRALGYAVMNSEMSLSGAVAVAAPPPLPAPAAPPAAAAAAAPAMAAPARPAAVAAAAGGAASPGPSRFLCGLGLRRGSGPDPSARRGGGGVAAGAPV